jgi:biopolymer transport protein ExbD
MRLFKVRRNYGCEINMTPMIDVVFQLIIFFMCVSSFARLAVENVTLPEAKEGKPPSGDVTGQIIVNVTKEGRILHLGNAHTLDSLQAVLGEQVKGADKEKVTVLVRGDKDCPWEKASVVLRACAANGIARVRVAVTTPGGR